MRNKWSRETKRLRYGENLLVDEMNLARYIYIYILEALFTLKWVSHPYSYLSDYARYWSSKEFVHLFA